MRLRFVPTALGVVLLTAGCGSRPPVERVHAATRATLAAGTASLQWRNGARLATGVVDFERGRGLVHYRGALGDTRDVLLLGADSWVRVHGGRWKHTHEADPLQELVTAPRLCSSARSARETGNDDYTVPGGTTCRLDHGKLVAVARRGVVAYADFGKPKPIASVPPA